MSLILIPLMLLWTRSPAYGESPTTDGGVSNNGSAGFSEASENNDLIEEVLRIAAEEIERAAGEAAKATALEYAGELAAARSLAGSWEAECRRLRAEAVRGKAAGFARGTVVFLGAFCAGAAAMYATEALRR
jgi:hypothetical protein